MARERVTFEVNGAQLAADRWVGTGRTLVLLHAGVADRRSWYATADLLSDVGTVVAYDRRGFGDSAPTSTPFTHLDDLLVVLDRITDEPAWLVASSRGGALAIDAAVVRADRIAGLALFAPAISGQPEDDIVDPASDRLFDQLAAAMEARDADEVIRLETWIWLDGPNSSEGRVGGAARELAMKMNRIIVGNNVDDETGASDVDAWSQLERITMPVTVAYGDLDSPFVVDACEQLARRLPHAVLRVLPGTAHLPYLEQPEAVARLIRDAVITG